MMDNDIFISMMIILIKITFITLNVRITDSQEETLVFRHFNLYTPGVRAVF